MMGSSRSPGTVSERIFLSAELIVVIPRLKKIDSAFGHPINKPMLLRDPAAPTASQLMPQRFRFAYAPKRVVQHCFHQFERAQSQFAVRLNPINQVFAEF